MTLILLSSASMSAACVVRIIFYESLVKAFLGESPYAFMWHILSSFTAGSFRFQTICVKLIAKASLEIIHSDTRLPFKTHSVQQIQVENQVISWRP